MAYQAPPIYDGPGKVYLNNSLGAGAFAMQAEGVNGAVTVAVTEETADIACAMFGKLGIQDLDVTSEITVKPFDNWYLTPALYPAYLGVTTNGVGPVTYTGALRIGARTHGATNRVAQVWTPDGRLYTAVRAAITGHPSLHLGVNAPLFGECKITGIGDINTAGPSSSTDPAGVMGGNLYIMGDSTHVNGIVESGAADPGVNGIPPNGEMSMADFLRQSWTGVWGTVPGFGGNSGDQPIQAEDEFTVEADVKYSPLKVQSRTFDYKLDSVAFMVKCRPVGPTHTQILNRVLSHTQGQRLGSADLVLTSLDTLHTIRLVNAEVKGAGFEFGGTKLGTGEIGFVHFVTFTSGVPNPALVLSA